jgi:hypothetical protein
LSERAACGVSRSIGQKIGLHAYTVTTELKLIVIISEEFAAELFSSVYSAEANSWWPHGKINAPVVVGTT